MDGLKALEVFVAVAESSSFSAAARRFSLAQSQVSRAIRDLESSIGVALFTRTTRQVILTPEGQTYLHGARNALNGLNETVEAVRDQTSGVRGTLRLTAPPAFAEHLAPVLATLAAAHPSLTIDSVLTNRIVDLAEEGFDVAIRFGPLGASDLRTRKVGETKSILCAAPSYTKVAGIPKSPMDLQSREFVVFTGKTAKTNLLVLRDSRNVTTRVRMQGRVRSNDLGIVREVAIAGAGIAVLPRTLIALQLRERRLVEILAGWTTPPTPIHALFLPGKPQVARVAAFVEAIATALRKRPLRAANEAKQV